jgi:hypothetical protein
MKVSIAAALSVIIESQISEQTSEYLRGQLSAIALEVFAHSLAGTESRAFKTNGGSGIMYRFADGSYAGVEGFTIIYMQPSAYASWDEAFEAYEMAKATAKSEGKISSVGNGRPRPVVPTGEVPCTCPVCREGGSA